MLVVGGFDGSTRHATTEILNIETMTFSPGPVMSLGRSSCAVVSLPGSVLVVGGCDGRGALNATEALSLQTMSFSAGPAMRMARIGCAAFVLPQDYLPRRALVVGGSRPPNLLSGHDGRAHGPHGRGLRVEPRLT